MADLKISQLGSIVTVVPATDVLPVVQGGTTYKVTPNQLLGAGGTATLASATITGALTVGTGANAAVLKASFLGGYSVFENSAGTGNPSITFNNDLDTGIRAPSANTLVFDAGGFEQYRIASSGVFSWSDGAGGTRMTLNATGLGVGVSPSRKLSVSGAGGGFDLTDTTQSTRIRMRSSSASNFYIEALNSAESAYVTLRLNDTTQIDASGNVGIGVTPSAWISTVKALQVGGVGCFWSSASTTGSVSLGRNIYENSAGDFTYIANSAALLYEQSSTGVHSWYSAAASTGTISFGSAKMTLDASGNLLLATTTNTPSARQYINQASGSNPALYIAGGASTTPLINFNGAGRMRSDGQYLVMETTNASGVIYVTANTNGVYLAVGGTSWTANSDERLKDIIEPISNAVAKVGSLRSVIGKFKNDETNTRRSFLIAQDVQAVLPEAVDASNPDRLGVAYSEIIPLLVAAIKELTARVQTLEAK